MRLLADVLPLSAEAGTHPLFAHTVNPTMFSTTQTDIEARAADWLAQRDSAQWSAADAQALDVWLTADTRHRVALLRLQAHWQQLAACKHWGQVGLKLGRHRAGSVDSHEQSS